MAEDPPIIEFTRLIPQARFPVRADRSGAGLIPSRAMRFCEALTTATAYGYWVFPPIDLRLLFDGEEIWWTFGDEEEWLPLSATPSRAVQFPDFMPVFNDLAPPEFRDCSPAFLTAMPERGGLQIWTGLLIRTRPGWSAMIRPPVNILGVPGLVGYEGIIETDLWYGPLFSNFRFTKTDIVVQIRAGEPLLQIQPLPRPAYSEDTHAAFRTRDSSDLGPDDWDRLSAILLPSDDPDERQGSYAVAVRKRRLHER